MELRKFYNVVLISLKWGNMIDKKLIIVVISLILLSSWISNVNADIFEKKDIVINSNDDYSERLWYLSDKGDKLEFQIKSSGYVNVYIIANENYKDWLFPPHNFTRAKYSDFKVTETKFTFKIPDDATYCFVINNPNDYNVTVDFEIVNLSEEASEDATFTAMCIAGIVVVVIAVIIYLYNSKKKGRSQQPHPPQQMYQPSPSNTYNQSQYPQQPPPQQYPPHQPPQYPPPPTY